MTKNKDYNLVPMNKQPPEIRKEMGRKGGLKSGEVRRARRAMVDLLNQMVNQPLPTSQKKAREALAKFGFSGEEATNGALINLQLMNLALSNQVENKTKLRAIEMIHKFIDGQKFDVTTDGKSLNQAPLLIEIIDKREQVNEEKED